MPISKDSFSSFFLSHPIIIFDTNVYLDLLRHSKASSIELINLYKSFIDDIRIPSQVYIEINKNFCEVIGKAKEPLKQAKKNIKNSINKCKNEILTQFNSLNRYGLINNKNTTDKATTELETLHSFLRKYIDDIIRDDNSFIDSNEVKYFIDTIWNANKSENYKPSRLMSIYQEGSLRYRYKIPPGYMDDPQNNSKSPKNGVDIFGDLILWNQIIDYACSTKRPVIFVTQDVKEDWFSDSSKQIPREELIAEFEEKTNGLNICIITSKLFIEYSSKLKGINTNMIQIEMSMFDYADITVRNNRKHIFNQFIEWSNKSENIALFPSTESVHTLIEIKNERYVVKDVSVKVDKRIYYSVTVEGVAEFIITNFDNTHINNILQFRLYLLLSRKYNKDSLGYYIPEKEVEDIQVLNVEFQTATSLDIPLESKRGIFITASNSDKEICEYMKNIWSKYEEKYLLDEAEALVYFDTAEHFDISLLEVNRAYSLVQNSISNSTLSLNEIDNLALKRFKDIGIKINGQIADYADKQAYIGTPYPSKESRILPPIEGMEIVVYFNINIECDNEYHISFNIETNLPFKTKLMLTLKSLDSKYIAQSKSVVNESQHFISEKFSNATNLPNKGLICGDYILEITVPIFSVQPEEIKPILGIYSRNLSGKYVKEDDIFGKTIHYSMNFSINDSCKCSIKTKQ